MLPSMPDAQHPAPSPLAAETQHCTPEDPEYYSELLCLLHHHSEQNSLSVKRYEQDIDLRDSVESLDTLLDSIAIASLPSLDHRCSTTASIGHGEEGLFSTTLYVIFDRPVADPRAVAHRLHQVFALLRGRSLPNPDHDPKELTAYLAGTFSSLLFEFYGPSWEVFVSIVTARRAQFQQLHRVVEAARPSGANGNGDEPPAWTIIFADLSRILEAVDKCGRNQMSRGEVIQVVGQIFNKWHQKNLLPRESDDDATTLFDRLDELALIRTNFSIRQWTFDLFSFHTGALTLLTIWLSDRHNPIFHGAFRVEILSSPPPTPYSCHLSLENLRAATNYAVDALSQQQQFATTDTDTDAPTAEEQAAFSKMMRGTVLRSCSGGGRSSSSSSSSSSDTLLPRPVVHCEIALLVYLKARAAWSIGYIGGSVTACDACAIALAACAERVNESVSRRDRQKRYCPGWTFPSMDEDVEAQIIPPVLESLQAEFGRDCNRWLDWKFVEDNREKKGMQQDER